MDSPHIFTATTGVVIISWDIPSKKPKTLLYLPTEIWLMVLSYLSFQELSLRVKPVSRRFCALANEELQRIHHPTLPLPIWTKIMGYLGTTEPNELNPVGLVCQSLQTLLVDPPTPDLQRNLFRSRQPSPPYLPPGTKLTPNPYLLQFLKKKWIADDGFTKTTWADELFDIFKKQDAFYPPISQAAISVGNSVALTLTSGTQGKALNVYDVLCAYNALFDLELNEWETAALIANQGGMQLAGNRYPPLREHMFKWVEKTVCPGATLEELSGWTSDFVFDWGNLYWCEVGETGLAEVDLWVDLYRGKGLGRGSRGGRKEVVEKQVGGKGRAEVQQELENGIAAPAKVPSFDSFLRGGEGEDGYGDNDSTAALEDWSEEQEGHRGLYITVPDGILAECAFEETFGHKFAGPYFD